MPVYKWSLVAAANASADSSINFAEGQAASTVNDSARAMMAAVAAWRTDFTGGLITTGTTTDYLLSTNSVYDSLADMDEALLCFTRMPAIPAMAGRRLPSTALRRRSST